ncbi:MAG: NADH-quinone oxidoreductase subunit NuoE [Proteobacteria bacterium]|nr:NADH-quinone oxidoreductase subunit NuoE [Pseudomonadota bacterium]
MSVRRLDLVQPENFAFSPDNLAWAKQTIAKYPTGKQASAVIPLLWRAQEQNEGWVSRPAIEYVASMLDMAYIRVLEVATFYTMFQLSPVGKKAHVQVCGTTPCMLRGAEDLKEVCRRKIHSEPHHVTADGNLSWEEVECLGSCVNAPMVQVWKDTYEDLTPEALEQLIDDWSAGRKTKPGPQNGRQYSMALGGASTLTDPEIYKGQRKFERIELPPPPPPAPAGAPAPAPAAAPAAAAPVTAKPAPAAVASAPAAAAPQPVAAPVAEPVAPKAKEAVVSKPSKPVLKSGAKEIEGRPELLKKPRTGKGDDLKLIWGVGPKLEMLLHKLGVWHFDQIASWTKTELAWVDEKLEGFKGRASRDEWVSQAKKLASGWRPESSVGDKPGKK